MVARDDGCVNPLSVRADCADCGQFLAGVGFGNRFEGTYATGQPGAMERTGSCDDYLDYPNWTAARKTEMRRLAQAWRSSLWHSFCASLPSVALLMRSSLDVAHDGRDSRRSRLDSAVVV